MKHIFLILTFAAGMWSGPKATINTALQQQLLQMYRNDQYEIEHHSRSNKLKIGKDSVTVTSDSMLRTIHNHMLKQIFDQHGYPGYDLVDTSGAHYFWLLVQHQDADSTFQKSVLAAMKVEVKKGLASGSDYAYLTDRVMVNTGHKQIYGTQMYTDPTTGISAPLPLEYPNKVEQLRMAAGLDSLKKYIHLMNSFYIDSTGTMHNK